MKKILLILILILHSFFCFARDKSIQEQVKDEYGNCYQIFQSNLASCTLSTCNYPDLSGAKTWRAQVIRGYTQDKKCYVINYSYIGDKIIGSPEHCFYDEEQQQTLYNLYKTLFSSNEIVIVTEAKQRIISLNYTTCKKDNPSAKTTKNKQSH